MTCASNLAIARSADKFANKAERVTGQDVDAFSQSDRDVLWFSLFGAFVSAASAGRSPNADDACAGVNNAADLIYDTPD